MPTGIHSTTAPPLCCFRQGDALRSRSVGGTVLHGHLHLPAPPAPLVADWDRDVRKHLALEPGDVEALSLPRARARWPDYRQYVQAAAGWTRTLGLEDLLARSDIALMACRGAHFHHDGTQYGGAAFCNLFLSDDRRLDVVFPGTGQRIPLACGTVLLFDTCQPHGVVPRGSTVFDAADFRSAQDATQVFLTWELPITHPALAQLLGIRLDVAPELLTRLDEEQVWVEGRPAAVCPRSGLWAPG